MEKSLADLIERTRVAEKVMSSLKIKRQEKASRKRKLDSAMESVAERGREVEVMRESLEKRERDLEERERGFLEFQQRKKREFASEEEGLSFKREMAGKKMKKIEAEEKSLRLDQESLLQREGKVKEFTNVLDARRREVEKKEEAFALFKEGKMRDIALKEEKLKKKWEELAVHVRESEKLKDRFMERIELAENKLDAMRLNIDEKLELIKLRDDGAGWESLALSVEEADLIRESLEKKMEELERMQAEFNAFQEKKIGEMASKEQQLVAMSEELVKDTVFRNEELKEREKLEHQLLERLLLAKNDVEALERRASERFEENRRKETELESIRDWIEKKMDETDLKAEGFEEREKRIAEMEDNLISKVFELKGKVKSLFAWEKKIEDRQKEVDSCEQQMKKLDAREKSMREFTRNCFKEHRAIKKDLAQRAEHLNHAQKDLELREEQMRDAKLKEQHLTNVFNDFSKIKSDESGADLELTLRMDGKTLQMFLNDSEKDLELMCDEIFKVLPLSSDPAKLVLDSMVGFYPPHLRTEDVELNVRRTCIAMLTQLIKISPSIKPCVREEAIQVATSWKSKMRAAGENAKPLEVLGFLFLLSAFDLVSCFNKDEIYGLLMMVDQHRETP